MSNIPAYPLGNFQERQKLQRRLLGWLPWKQTVLETGPFPLNEKLLHWKPPFLSASCQQLFCRRCPLEAEAAQRAELLAALQWHRHRGDTELLSPGPGTVHPGHHRVTSVGQWTEHRTPSHTGGELWQWPEQQLCPGTVARPQRAAVTALQNLSTEWVLPVHPALLPRTPNHICSHPRICIFQTP